MKQLFCLILALFGGIGLSQAPEFTQQYSQRLGGAIDELETIIARFDADAAQFGLTRDEGLERYAQSPDDFLAERGASMSLIFDRYAQLTAQRAALADADPFSRLVSIAAYFDTDVGAAALDAYRPAVPVTVDGLAHAGIGLIIGYLAGWGGWSVGAMPFRRRKRKKARAAQAGRIEPHL